MLTPLWLHQLRNRYATGLDHLTNRITPTFPPNSEPEESAVTRPDELGFLAADFVPPWHPH
jgi:hypothetical protein